MKWIKKILLWGLIVFLFVAGTGIVLVNIYEEDIKKIAIDEINKNLVVEMKVESYEVSFLKTFPNISLFFKNIEIAESSVIANKPFAKAENFYLVFSIWDIIQENYTITKIKASNGEVNVYEKGDSANYWIVKTDENDSSNSAFKLSMVEFSNMKFEYSNDKNKSFISLNVDQVGISGDFNTNGSFLVFEGNGFSDSLTLNKKPFLKNKDFTIESEFSFTTEHLGFKDTKVGLGEFKLLLNGTIDLLEEGNAYDLKYRTDQAPLSSLFGLVPNEYMKELITFDAEGEFELMGEYKGMSTNNMNPHLETEFKIENASITEPHANKKIENISLIGSYTNGKGNNSADSDLKILGINCSLNGRSLQGEFRMNNFESPFLNMKLKGSTNFEDWNGFLNATGISFKGTADFDVLYFGNVRDLKAGLQAGQRSKGNIVLKNVSMHQQNSNLNFDKVNGVLDFNGQNIKYNDFKGFVSGNEFKADGELQGIMAYLLGAQDELKINTKLHFVNLDFNSFTDKVTEADDDEIIPYQIPVNLALNSTLSVGDFTYNKIKIQDVKSSLRIKNGRLVVTNFTSKLLGGNFGFYADLKNHEGEKLLGKMNFKGNGIDANKMFYQFNNFGQETLKSEHLQGVVDVKVEMGVLLNKDLSIDEDMFYAHVNLKIKDGRLKGFEPLEAMASYIKISELKDIRFKTLENDFEIKDGQIILPKMRISNTALNLSIGGTHSFKNYMDYGIQVKLADVLSSKYGGLLKSKNQSEDGTQVFLKMVGTPDDLKFSYDKVNVKVIVKETVKDEKKTIKELINKELFKKEKKDTVSKEKVIEEEYKSTEWDE